MRKESRRYRAGLGSESHSCLHAIALMSDEGAVRDDTERERLEAELIERREAALANVVKDPVLKSKARRSPISVPSCGPRSSR